MENERTQSDSTLTFVAEGEPPFFTRLNVGHPDVAVVNEADEVGVHQTDFGVHARAAALALYLKRLHRQSLRARPRMKRK